MAPHRGGRTPLPDEATPSYTTPSSDAARSSEATPSFVGGPSYHAAPLSGDDGLHIPSAEETVVSPIEEGLDGEESAVPVGEGLSASRSHGLDPNKIYDLSIVGGRYVEKQLL